jgi:hypothetical protein
MRALVLSRVTKMRQCSWCWQGVCLPHQLSCHGKVLGQHGHVPHESPAVLTSLSAFCLAAHCEGHLETFMIVNAEVRFKLWIVVRSISALLAFACT